MRIIWIAGAVFCAWGEFTITGWQPIACAGLAAFTALALGDA